MLKRRVVRFSSRTPSLSSSRVICLLTAEGVRCSLRAAAENPASRTNGDVDGHFAVLFHSGTIVAFNS